MAMSHRTRARGNAIGLWIHRTFKGRLDGGGKEGGVLMVTSPGRRTGLPRSAMVRYLDDGLELSTAIETVPFRYSDIRRLVAHKHTVLFTGDFGGRVLPRELFPPEALAYVQRSIGRPAGNR